MIARVMAGAICLFPLLVYAAPLGHASWGLSGKRIAVLVLPESETAAFYAKTAQARIEGILGDNRVTLLDKEEADKLKDGWQKFEDPGYIVTAEDFVANAGKYELDGVLRISLEVQSFKGLAAFFSATAHINARFIAKDAQVSSTSSTPMGVPGSPPSDGLMASDALVNAIQRAVDSICRKAGLAVLVPASPYCIDVALKEPVRLQGKYSLPAPQNDRKLARHMNLETKTVHAGESITATALSPGGGVAAVCGYKRQSHRAGGSDAPRSSADSGNRSMNIAMSGGGPGFSRGSRMYYSSVVHLVDAKRGKEIGSLEAEEVGSGGRGSREIVAVAFENNWRYLAGVSERNVFLWDTQRGRCLTKFGLPKFFKPFSIGILTIDKTSQVVVADKRKRKVYAYKIEEKQDIPRW